MMMMMMHAPRIASSRADQSMILLLLLHDGFPQ
jgi:hypothetical protein